MWQYLNGPVHLDQAFPWESNLEETATVTSL